MIPEDKAQQAPFRSRLAGGEDYVTDEARDQEAEPVEPPIKDNANNKQPESPETQRDGFNELEEVAATEQAFPWQPDVDEEIHQVPLREPHEQQEVSNKPQKKPDYTPSRIDERLARRKSVREQLALMRAQRDSPPSVKKPVKRLQEARIVPKPDGPSAIEQRIQARKEKREAEARARAAEKPDALTTSRKRRGVKRHPARSAGPVGRTGGVPGALEERIQERRERKAREERILEQVLREEQERQRRHRKTPVVMEPVHKPEPSQYSLKFQKNKSQISVPRF